MRRSLTVLTSIILTLAIGAAAADAAGPLAPNLPTGPVAPNRPTGPVAPNGPTGPVTGRYINPFASPGWEPSRTDMGVDWIPTRKLPVKAIGAALILGADSHAPWPGHHLIWYQLLGGSHAGDVVYVAENLRHLIRAGTVVRAGQTIATALPAYPYTEWGWATQWGSPRAYPCYHEGRQTSSGREMARFLQSLGAAPGDPPGRGSNAPTGRPC